MYVVRYFWEFTSIFITYSLLCKITYKGEIIFCEIIWVLQYKCQVPIYVFPEMKLRSRIIPKQNYNILSPNFHIHVLYLELLIYSQDQSACFAAAK